jgi:hypothetical protein
VAVMGMLIKRGKRNNKGKRQEMEKFKEGRRKKSMPTAPI